MRPEINIGDEKRYLRAARWVDGTIYFEIGGNNCGFSNYEMSADDEKILRSFLAEPWPKWPPEIRVATSEEK